MGRDARWFRLKYSPSWSMKSIQCAMCFPPSSTLYSFINKLFYVSIHIYCCWSSSSSSLLRVSRLPTEVELATLEKYSVQCKKALSDVIFTSGIEATTMLLLYLDPPLSWLSNNVEIEWVWTFSPAGGVRVGRELNFKLTFTFLFQYRVACGRQKFVLNNKKRRQCVRVCALVLRRSLGPSRTIDNQSKVACMWWRKKAIAAYSLIWQVNRIHFNKGGRTWLATTHAILFCRGNQN